MEASRKRAAMRARTLALGSSRVGCATVNNNFPILCFRIVLDLDEVADKGRHGLTFLAYASCAASLREGLAALARRSSASDSQVLSKGS